MSWKGRGSLKEEAKSISNIQLYVNNFYSRTATAMATIHDPANDKLIVGPLRVLPGRLSVSRTFGDAEAKLPKYGGN